MNIIISFATWLIFAGCIIFIIDIISTLIKSHKKGGVQVGERIAGTECSVDSNSATGEGDSEPYSDSEL